MMPCPRPPTGRLGFLCEGVPGALHFELLAVQFHERPGELAIDLECPTWGLERAMRSGGVLQRRPRSRRLACRFGSGLLRAANPLQDAVQLPGRRDARSRFLTSAVVIVTELVAQTFDLFLVPIDVVEACCDPVALGLDPPRRIRGESFQLDVWVGGDLSDGRRSDANRYPWQLREPGQRGEERMVDCDIRRGDQQHALAAAHQLVDRMRQHARLAGSRWPPHEPHAGAQAGPQRLDLRGKQPGDVDPRGWRTRQPALGQRLRQRSGPGSPQPVAQLVEEEPRREGLRPDVTALGR